MEKQNLGICETPFTYVETHTNGDVSLCCPGYIGNYTIGNFYDNVPFESIWNGEKAKEFRNSILNGSYKYCNTNFCDYKPQEKTNQNIFNSPHCQLPLFVSFCHDEQCNVKCITCRNEILVNSKEKEALLNSQIDTTFLPLLKNAKLVSLNGGGEVFASNHMKNLIKTITKVYPHILFKIHSNGILFDKEHCDELGITNKILLAEVSIHAATKSTYDKIVIGGNFNKVMQNIKWLSSLKEKKQLKNLRLTFVITSINYKEMINFQKLANKLNCDASYTTYRPWDSELSKRYDEIAIFEPKHPKHKQFIKIIQNKIFDSSNCIMQNSLIELRKKHTKETLTQEIINYFTKNKAKH